MNLVINNVCVCVCVCVYYFNIYIYNHVSVYKIQALKRERERERERERSSYLKLKHNPQEWVKNLAPSLVPHHLCRVEKTIAECSGQGGEKLPSLSSPCYAFYKDCEMFEIFCVGFRELLLICFFYIYDFDVIWFFNFFNQTNCIKLIWCTIPFVDQFTLLHR